MVALAKILLNNETLAKQGILSLQTRYLYKYEIERQLHRANGVKAVLSVDGRRVVKWAKIGSAKLKWVNWWLWMVVLALSINSIKISLPALFLVEFHCFNRILCCIYPPACNDEVCASRDC